MEKINNSQSVSSMRNRRTGLDPDPSGTDSCTVSGCTFQMEFDTATRRGKRMKEKHSGHKNNYMHNLSSKKLVNHVKIGGDG